MANKKSSHISSVLSVYGYTDYRQYLRDFYQFRKQQSRGYSFRQFSMLAGFSAPNVLKLVMDGKRNIGSTSVQNFIKALGLEGRMAAYFATLVELNHAPSIDAKSEMYEKLKQLTPVGMRRFLDEDSMEYLSHPIMPVLRELSQHKDFRDDPYWIARRLITKASVAETMAALRFLVDHKFIEKTPDGRYVAKDNLVLSSDEVRSLAIRKYHKKILQQASIALEELPMEQREFGALTFSLPEASFEELKARIKEFRLGLIDWAVKASETETNDQNIVQVNIQMYPQTRKDS